MGLVSCSGITPAQPSPEQATEPSEELQTLEKPSPTSALAEGNVSSRPQSRAETAEERKARLYREADLRAGLEPGKPLPKWDLSSMKSAVEEPEACVVGTHGRLEITGGAEGFVGGELDVLEQSEAVVELTDGRHRTDRVLGVARLVGATTSDVIAVNCRGVEAVIPASELTPDDRWVVVRNQRKELKLLDRGRAEGKDKPVLRHVTAFRRTVAP